MKTVEQLSAIATSLSQEIMELPTVAEQAIVTALVNSCVNAAHSYRLTDLVKKSVQ